MANRINASLSGLAHNAESSTTLDLQSDGITQLRVTNGNVDIVNQLTIAGVPINIGAAQTGSAATLAALKALTTRPPTMVMQGQLSAGDGLGGIYVWIAGSTATPDDYLVIQPTSGPAGRYIHFMTALTRSNEIRAEGGMVLNKMEITADYTLPTGYNAMSAGPITIDNDVTVTVPSGQTWTIV